MISNLSQLNSHVIEQQNTDQDLKSAKKGDSEPF